MNHRDNERAQKGVKILQEARHKIRHFLLLIWYFLTEKSPDHTMIEEKLEHMPETQAQRIRRRWQRSRERATRQRMNKAA
jgi:hypothetical protein